MNDNKGRDTNLLVNRCTNYFYNSLLIKYAGEGIRTHDYW